MCLFYVQLYEDVLVYTKLVKIGYGRVTSIAFCTAGGVGEEQHEGIYDGLNFFCYFLRDLHEGRNYMQPSFQQLLLLARRTEEQIEEDGSNEELEAQIKINGCFGRIMKEANRAKATILNRFTHRG
ncbi:MAG: hypothetical protein EZS28_031213 [Streblomastix strix]|uniref:Uncharacterized protein n=1 Tax=Streblomastix strix TaxID=222440 RepID=A0A5J4USY7_9EUKA|nr:MAG: hypothetical protein EZS28_031213 [Streblomastix strix]